MQNIESYIGKNILIAGTTRSGKSAFMETFAVELVRKFSPEEARLLIIDPKRVQFSYFNEVPHLLRPVVYEVEAAEAALRDIWLEALVRIRGNEARHMSIVTVVIDEIADAMVSNPTTFEELIEKITAVSSLSRIYVVLATSRPDGERILTERLRSCFPLRIAFRIKQPEDSMVVIGDAGAIHLVQAGDALIRDETAGTLVSVQVPHIGHEERAATVKHISEF